MKTIKIDNYTIKKVSLDTGSNYDLIVHILKDKTLYFGTTFRNDASDMEIIEWAIKRIKEPITDIFI